MALRVRVAKTGARCLLWAGRVSRSDTGIMPQLSVVAAGNNNAGELAVGILQQVDLGQQFGLHRLRQKMEIRQVPLVPAAIQKGTRVLISLWNSLMFGRVPGPRPNISESHSEICTRVPFCIVQVDVAQCERGGCGAPPFHIYRDCPHSHFC